METRNPAPVHPEPPVIDLCACPTVRPPALPNARVPLVVGLVLLGLGSTISSAMADEITLLPTRDATLFQDDDGDLANGSGSYLFVGVGNDPKRALLAFDIASSIPAGSIIESVELELNMSRTIVSGMRLELYRMTADWGEGASDAGGQEGAGIDSEPGDATWQHRYYPDTPWTDPGGDFVAVPSAERIVNAEGPYAWGPTPEMVADVQGWLDDPSTDFGWVVIGPELFFQSAKRFDSRENSDPARRPRLRIVFQPPPPIVPEVPLSRASSLLLLGLVALAGLVLLRRS